MKECNDCKYYDEEDDICFAFVCDGIECAPLPCEMEEEKEK